MLLDPEELECMRADMADTLSQQAVISRYRETVVGGRPAHTFEPDANPIACRVGPPKGQRESSIGEQIKPVADAEIRLPYGTPLSTNDQITVAGQTFDVIGHDAERADATLLTVQVVRVGIPAQTV